jgi:hypothetical protein
MDNLVEKPFPLPRHLLWKYDFETFDFDRSYKIVIERVVQRGNMDDWRNILHYYGKDKILEVVDWSPQLDNRDKTFARIFVDSGFINHAA